MDELRIRELALSLVPERAQLAAFLQRHDLSLEDDVACAFGIFDAEDRLHGCGCAAGKLLKCFAIDETLRGRNGLGALLSRLSAERFAAGFDDLFVITRPRNRGVFSACGFYPVAETADTLFLENRKNGVERFLRGVVKAPEGAEPVGAIVMNCNPLTNGHLALIQHAAARCEFLYVFVVEENRSFFQFADRLDLVRQATEGMENVQVCPSGPYIISAMTFPTYFIKKTESPAGMQAELDLTLFGTVVAPGLRISKRFAGQESLDAVTRAYNGAMRELLPRFQIEFCEIPRVKADGVPISASAVRRLLREAGGMTQTIARMVPPCTQSYLIENHGWAKGDEPR